MESKKKNKAKEILLFAVLGLAFCVLAVLISQTNKRFTPEDMITQYMARYGVNTEGISFSEDESYDIPLFSRTTRYVSSEPVVYQGHEITYWSYTVNQMGLSGLISSVEIETYPAMPEPVEIDLSISQIEYESLKRLAGDVTVEDYILQLIATTAEQQS